ncbi:hypothetical protein X899_6084 [Burkholderia pseudomallei TSV 25]|nr:hypothetical protein X899_6084 [Burkholderia pseudomallei TSV 25]
MEHVRFFGAGDGEAARRELHALAQAVVVLIDRIDTVLPIGRRDHEPLDIEQRRDVFERRAARVGEQQAARLVVDELPQQDFAIGVFLKDARHGLGFERERRDDFRLVLGRIQRYEARLALGEQRLEVERVDDVRRGELRKIDGRASHAVPLFVIGARSETSSSCSSVQPSMSTNCRPAKASAAAAEI